VESEGGFEACNMVPNVHHTGKGAKEASVTSFFIEYKVWLEEVAAERAEGGRVT